MSRIGVDRMNNKKDIEEDIKILEDIEILEFTASKIYMNPEKINIALKNLIKAYKDRERLEKENEEYKIKENSRICGKYNEIEIHDLIEQTIQKDYITKANAYDSLVEKIKENIKELKKNINIYEKEEKNIIFREFWHNELLKATHKLWALQELLDTEK